MVASLREQARNETSFGAMNLCDVRKCKCGREQMPLFFIITKIVQKGGHIVRLNRSTCPLQFRFYFLV